MAVISISEAARTWRIVRSTLQRALQEGRLSTTVRADGSRGIDTAELIRVFGEAPVALQERGSSEVQRVTPIAADSTIATLQAQVDSLQAQLQEWTGTTSVHHSKRLHCKLAAANKLQIPSLETTCNSCLTQACRL